MPAHLLQHVGLNPLAVLILCHAPSDGGQQGASGSRRPGQRCTGRGMGELAQQHWRACYGPAACPTQAFRGRQACAASRPMYHPRPQHAQLPSPFGRRSSGRMVEGRSSSSSARSLTCSSRAAAVQCCAMQHAAQYCRCCEASPHISARATVPTRCQPASSRGACCCQWTTPPVAIVSRRCLLHCVPFSPGGCRGRPPRGARRPISRAAPAKVKETAVGIVARCLGRQAEVRLLAMLLPAADCRNTCKQQ